MKHPLLVITGPTASGKTALSVKLAKKYGGEIINCDSMQVYCGMDIGTAKPTMEERDGVAHHLIDVVEPTVNFSLADFLKLSRTAAADIANRGHLPILVGGTGLYIDTFVYNIDIGEFGQDLELREKLKETAQEKGNEILHNLLKRVDPEAAEKIHPSNVKRVIRALEVYHITGRKISEIQKESRNKEPDYDHRIYAISVERELLYERINQRVDQMMQQGLVQEVELLRERGVSLGNTAMQGIGYKEIYAYLDGGCSLEDTVALIKQKSRQYAKRQMTWFKRNQEIIWLDYYKIN